MKWCPDCACWHEETEDYRLLRPAVALVIDRLILNTDGGCWPNPGGDPRWGWVARTPDGPVLAQAHGVVTGLPEAERTNNVAEWLGVIEALKWVRDGALRVDVLELQGDSQLILGQLEGRWRAKKPHLARYLAVARAVAAELDVGDLTVTWVPREQNELADSLADMPKTW